MTIEIAGYSFAGPYSSTASLEDRSGVYTVLTPTDATHYKVIDVGESATVKTRLDTHDRRPCWQKDVNNGNLCYAVYTPGLQQAGRQEIEQKIRRQYHPPCGVQ